MAVAVFIDLMALFTYFDDWPMNPIYGACDAMDGNSCQCGSSRSPIVYFSPCDVYPAHGTVFLELFNINKNN
jgi:hypothetical protein